MERTTFISYKVSDVQNLCMKQNHAITELLCKLTYINSVETQNHWMRNLAGIMVKNAKDKFKCKAKFSYLWFFDYDGFLDEDTSWSYINTIDEKYDSIKPIEFDPYRLINNIDDLRVKLQSAYILNGYVLLTSQDIIKILSTLDIVE